jgi:pimeloyl-ACP methyl ester carboxylesterase
MASKTSAAVNGHKGMALVRSLIWLVSRISPRAGASIAWYLWFRARGRRTGRYPDGATPFSFSVLEHDLAGYTLGSGDPVLLLHGWGGASTDMGPLAASVAAAGYQAVAIDLPGHGVDRKSRTDLFRMAAAVDTTASIFGSPRAVVAHSFGATAAFAAFPHGGPERLVLVAPGIKGSRFFDVFLTQAGLGKRASQLFMARFRRFAGPYLLGLLDGVGDVPGADVLILHDPEDDRTPYVDSARYAEQRNQTKLVDVPASGHKGILRDRRTRLEAAAFLESA